MFGLGRKKTDTVYGVLVDVGSGSVGVAIIASNHRQKLPEILYTHRNYMRITRRGANKNERMRQMREALFSASLILSKDGLQVLAQKDPHARIEKIFVTCSSPWSHTIARNVHYENDEDIKVSESLIHDLVESAEVEIERNIGDTDTVHAEGFEVVERATVDVRINDYPVAHPIGLRGKQITLSHITGLIPKEILEAVYEVQEKLFPSTEVRAHTFMLIMYCILRDLFPKNDSVCIVDVTGEATEFGIVENGLLLENVYAPYGSNTLMRDVMAKTGQTSGEILATLQTFMMGKTTKEVSNEVETHLLEYRSALTATLNELSAHRKIPKTIIVTAHHGLEDLFTKQILEVLNTTSQSNYSTLTIKPELLEEITPSVDPDTYLSLAGRFFHKLHGCGEMSDK